MKNSPRALIAAALISCAPAVAVRADAISLASSKDNTLYEDPFGIISNGAGEHFFVGSTAGLSRRRGLMAFDLVSALPQGTTINSASLTLVMSRSQGLGEVIELHAAQSDWGEGASNAGENGGGGTIASPGDATWLNTFYDTGTWTNAGGDFSSTISSSTTIGFAGTYTIPSTAQMTTDLQGWLNSPATNFGWVIKGDESTFSTAARFESHENAIPSNRPNLSLDVTLPAGTSVRAFDADGDWDNAAQWAGGVPNSAGAHAFFGNSITAPRFVSFTTPETVGRITLASPFGYILNGTMPLTIDGAGGTIQVSAGSHSILAPINLATSTTINVNSGATLTMNNDMTSGATASLTKTGAGQLRVKHIRAAGLALSQGSISVLSSGSASGASAVGSLSISAGAQLDLTNNSLIINYSGATIAGSIRSMLVDGRLTSSLTDAAHTLGYADEATDVKVKYAFRGDSNLDGMVDIRDLTALALHFNTASGDWTSGDFNLDGLVNVADLTVLAKNWQAGVGAPSGPPIASLLEGFHLPMTGVPEPSGVMAFGAAVALLASRRSRRAIGNNDRTHRPQISPYVG